MNEILPGIFHWTTLHEGIGQPVSSYYVVRGMEAVVIDPRVPDEGMGWFDGRPAPAAVVLTNRHHLRHGEQFAEAYGCSVLCQTGGLDEFTSDQCVGGYQFGDHLPAGIETIEIGSLCPEETALYIPWARAVAFADALVRMPADGPLGFVPDFLLGDDPAAVKRGLLAALRRVLYRDFDHILLAHGMPWIGGGKAALRAFVEAHESR